MAVDQDWIADLLAGYRTLVAVDDAVTPRNVLRVVGASVVDNPNYTDPETGQPIGSTDLVVPSNAVSVIAYGGIGDGSTDNTGAIVNAYDALPETGGTILFPDGGTYLMTGVSFTKPIRLQFGRCTVQGTSAKALFTTNTNLVIEGFSQWESTLAPYTGQVALALAGNMQQQPGQQTGQVFIARDIGFTGGSRGIDTSGINFVGGYYFSDGFFLVRDCLFQNTSSQALYIADDISFTYVQWNSFYGCNGSMWIGAATETECKGNVHFPANGATNPNITLAGVAHVHLDKENFVGATNYLQPDILMYGTSQDATGQCKITGCKFAPEREFTYATSRCRILNYNASNPQYACVDVSILNNYFYAPSPPVFPCSIVVSGGIATATITLPVGQTSHGIAVGDTVSAIFASSGTVCGGPFTVIGSGHAPTNTTISWNTPASNGTYTGGFILPGAPFAPIVLKSPHSQWMIDGNQFYGYPLIVNDNASFVPDTGNNYGQSVWGSNNRTFGPSGRECLEFLLGGQGFRRVDTAAAAAFPAVVDRVAADNPGGLMNRIYNSECKSADWGAVNGTVTAGATDPFGTTRACTLKRNGAGYIWLSSAIVEGFGAAIDVGNAITFPANAPAISYLSFWAKKGGSNPSGCITFLIPDGLGNLVFFQTFTLGTNWKKYQVPIVWPADFVANTPAAVSELYFAPGSQEAEESTCELFGLQICDLYPCDYLATDTTPATAAITASSATGGSATLPSNPIGFKLEVINGTVRKVPYYAV